MGKKVETNIGPVDESRYFKCPGCKGLHSVRVKGKGAVWGYNWNDNSPTFSPSLLVRYPANPNATPEFKEWYKERVCHSFIREGKIQFLNDCTHKLAGQTVELKDID